MRHLDVVDRVLLRLRAGEVDVEDKTIECWKHGSTFSLTTGEPQTLPGPCTVLALLEAKDLAGRRVAVEVNGAIVPRSLHPEHALKDGDRIEIVHALGGG